MSCAGVMQRVASPVPMTAGTPNSRLTMAAWLVGPPWSVTMPAALRMIGTQSGSVLSVTRIAPSTKFAMSSVLRMMHAGPQAIASPTAAPVAIALGALTASRQFFIAVADRAPCTVSGRACTMKSLPLSPSFAHSMSMGQP